jgi:hypothetical protein
MPSNILEARTKLSNNRSLDVSYGNSDGINRIFLSDKESRILTQDMINQPNTIYIIQSDMDLGGRRILIPRNCILRFDGGSLKNGIVVGNKTLFDGIVKAYVKLDGTFNNDELCLNWFLEDTSSSIHSVCNNIIDVLCNAVSADDLYKNCVLSIQGGTYNLNNTIFLRPFCKLKAVGAVLIRSSAPNAAIVIRPNAEDIVKMNTFDKEYNTKPYYNGDIIQGNNSLTLMSTTHNKGIGLWVGAYGDVEPSRIIVTNTRISGLSLIGFDTGIHLTAYHLYHVNFDHIEIQRCNNAIKTAKAKWNSGFEGFTNWDEHISVTNSMLGGNIDDTNSGYGLTYGNCFLMDVNTAIHIDNTSIDYFSCIFYTPEKTKATIRAHLSNCHIEGNAQRSDESLDIAQGLVNKYVSKESAIRITNSRIMLSTLKQGVFIPETEAEIALDNVIFNCTMVNNGIFDDKWMFLSKQKKALSAMQCYRPLFVSNGHDYRTTPALSYYNNLVPDGLFEKIKGASAGFQTLKRGYSYDGFTFWVNSEAKKGKLITNDNSIFKCYNNNQTAQFELYDNTPLVYTIESPSFYVRPLSKYGLNYGLQQETNSGSSRIKVGVEVLLFDKDDHLVEKIIKFDGGPAHTSILVPGLIHWAPLTSRFEVGNNAQYAKVRLILTCDDHIKSGVVRCHGIYVENQD